MIQGTVRGAGYTYEGINLEAVYVTVGLRSARGLPFKVGGVTKIELIVGGRAYDAELCATAPNKDVWIRADAKEKATGKKLKQAQVLHGIGKHKNDRVSLSVNGNQVTLA
ncbi:MAG TPA: hypothetical protein VIM11_24390 [Tepidisphaeraceae bacterium]|jgi:uncharacterized Fe-S cluster-containing radical SAM superfamily enzyme